MSKSPVNRLDSLWPTGSPDDQASPLFDTRQIAAKLEPMIQNAGETIAEYPRVSLTAAATLGALVGWFIKRK